MRNEGLFFRQYGSSPLEFMRFRLRTLLMAGIAGPPLLALAWYVAIWARYGLADAILNVRHELLLTSLVGTIALLGWSIAAPPPGSRPSAELSLRHLAALLCATFFVLWHGLWILLGIGGWMFLWGDNGPPLSQQNMLLITATVALLLSVLIGIRIGAGLTTVNYVLVLWCLDGSLAGTAALLWCGYALR